MCLLVAKPAETPMDYDVLWELYESARKVHRDGFGLAYAKNGIVCRYRTMDKMSKDELVQMLKGGADCPLLLHWRLGTHGSRNKENCHPFFVKTSDGSTFALGHNGVVSDVYSHNTTKSDTAMLAELLEGKHREEAKAELNKRSSYCNKFVTLFPDGELNIHDEKNMGHWDNGIWFSNRMHTYQGREWDYSGGYNQSYVGGSYSGTTTTALSTSKSLVSMSTYDENEKRMRRLCDTYGMDVIRSLIDDIEFEEQWEKLKDK